MQPTNVPPSSAPDKRDEQPKPKTLLLEFNGIYELYGAVADLDTISDAELRETVAHWVEPKDGRPPCRFIVRSETGRILLVGPLNDGFQVRAAHGEVLEHVPTGKPTSSKNLSPASEATPMNDID